jgi:hypothetical protein
VGVEFFAYPISRQHELGRAGVATSFDSTFIRIRVVGERVGEELDYAPLFFEKGVHNLVEDGELHSWFPIELSRNRDASLLTIESPRAF